MVSVAQVQGRYMFIEYLDHSGEEEFVPVVLWLDFLKRLGTVLGLSLKINTRRCALMSGSTF